MIFFIIFLLLLLVFGFKFPTFRSKTNESVITILSKRDKRVEAAIADQRKILTSQVLAATLVACIVLLITIYGNQNFRVPANVGSPLHNTGRGSTDTSSIE